MSASSRTLQQTACCIVLKPVGLFNIAVHGGVVFPTTLPLDLAKVRSGSDGARGQAPAETIGSTPIREIAELNIGSRPASRKASQRIEDLRAIPWSFSWGQCRLTLPGWYGFGTAVHEFLTVNPDQDRREGLALLQKMYKQWPFFRALLSNMDMVLAKSDLALASRYAELVTDARLRKRIFATIEAEWHRTVDALQLVTGEKQRLATNPALQRSIRHRFPYIDPLHHLQVELVRRHREGKLDDRARRGIHISINGIAAGLRNTG